ncbi:MAG: hypothetical protein LBH97_02830 [Treponema sp.]|nr:hypothetical protein [Treponema sp.]
MIIGFVILWYGLVPIAGALVTRYKWRRFRQRFDELRLRPLLDYSLYRQIGEEGGSFRFMGGFESVTDGQTLWIKGENMTIPVSLTNAQTFFLPMTESEKIPESFDPGDEAPERIRWDRISTLTEGARVFIGGSLVYQDGRWIFVSTREHPLLVIFYDGSDRSLTARTIRAGRRRNEYWNAVTPYSLAIGVLCQLLIAISFLSRPAFRLTVVTALSALFTPLFPLIPPGLLFTVVYRRLSWRARILRAYHDLIRLPLRYFAPEKISDRKTCRLPNGELYGCIYYESLPPAVREQNIPILLPEYSIRDLSGGGYIVGALSPESELPVEPQDTAASFGILPPHPEALARRYAITAYMLEAAAWIALLAGIGLNIFFLRMLLSLL